MNDPVEIVIYVLSVGIPLSFNQRLSIL